MKFFIWFLVQSAIGYVKGYVPVICSSNGGICKIEDLNQMAVTFLDDVSDYAHNGYMVYCRYVCTIFQYVFGKWINFNGKLMSMDWKQKLYYDYFMPVVSKNIL